MWLVGSANYVDPLVKTSIQPAILFLFPALEEPGSPRNFILLNRQGKCRVTNYYSIEAEEKKCEIFVWGNPSEKAFFISMGLFNLPFSFPFVYFNVNPLNHCFQATVFSPCYTGPGGCLL